MLFRSNPFAEKKFIQELHESSGKEISLMDTFENKESYKVAAVIQAAVVLERAGVKLEVGGRPMSIVTKNQF